MLRSVLVLTALFIVPLAYGQSPCAAEEARQLDFWVGEWDLTWDGGQGGTPEGETGHGTNTITKELGGCVIHERFESADGYVGESMSVYHQRVGAWRQTWVDNRGGYLLLDGGMDDEAMELCTAPFPNPQGQTQINRMTWRNVTDDALDWHWQRSTDGGETWTDQWVIHYTRR